MTASLVTGRGLSLRGYKDTVGGGSNGVRGHSGCLESGRVQGGTTPLPLTGWGGRGFCLRSTIPLAGEAKRGKGSLKRDRTAKGQTGAWQSKKTSLPQSKTLSEGGRRLAYILALAFSIALVIYYCCGLRAFKKRPCGPVLKDKQ